MDGYDKMYRKSVNNKENFWMEYAIKKIHWTKEPKIALDSSNPPFYNCREHEFATSKVNENFEWTNKKGLIGSHKGQEIVNKNMKQHETKRHFTSTSKRNDKIKVDNIHDFNILREKRIEFISNNKNYEHDKVEVQYQNDIKAYFAELLNVNNLRLGEINLSSNEDVLHQYVGFETVLDPANTPSLLQKRLGHGRRVFSLNHPLLDSFPLAFVNVGLTNGIADSLEYIDAHTGTLDLEQNANTAMFYSICTAPGLHGLSFGNFLIKAAVEKLTTEMFPNNQLQQFSTLSPIPSFRKWLEYESQDDILDVIIGDQKFEHRHDGEEKNRRYLIYDGADKLTKDEILEKIYNVNNQDGDFNLTRLPLVAHYLIDKKSHKNVEQALCPVANFHLSNGAILHRLNKNGDMSINGIKRSYGVMVNYLYDLDHLNENSKNYKARGIIQSNIGWGL